MNDSACVGNFTESGFDFDAKLLHSHWDIVSDGRIRPNGINSNLAKKYIVATDLCKTRPIVKEAPNRAVGYGQWT